MWLFLENRNIFRNIIRNFRIFSVGISVSPPVCLILVLISISKFKR